MASDTAGIGSPIRLGEGLELDARAYELRRSGRALKLERIPMELLLLLIEQKGQLVTRDQIIARIWGKDAFLDADNSINAAIRKIRQALKDDPERPRFIQTITGKGYRFIAPVAEASVPLAGQAAVSPPITAPESLIGKKVSHYRVLQILGGGGMGVVYKAEDLKLGRSVAMKFLPGEYAADARAFERVQQEARAASSLDHPNICGIYELGEHEGRPFIVMQLLQGQTLREWIEKASDRESPGCLKELLNLSVQICSGLESAHEKGIVHRDIKPANIFVTSRGEAKILDFGVAKFESTTGNEDAGGEGAAPGLSGQEEGEAGPGANLTESEASMGTPAYLSPEQVRGEKLDARTDLFSFGLVLYEMATGRQAFSGNTVAVIRDAVLHISAAAPRQLQPELPTELERIIQKALEKDRDLRYQSAAQIRTDLESLAASVSVQPADGAAPAAVTAATVQEVRKRPGRIVVAAAVLLVAALVAGGFYYRSQQAIRLNEKDTIVVADFANSTGDPIFDDTLKQGLSLTLHQSPFLTILSDDKVAENLKLMTRPAKTALTPEVAREVCQRAGSKAYMEGAIAALGNEYVLGLKAVNCRSGDILAREQVTVAAKEKVIAALGDAASKLRGELGESLATVQKYDVPLEEATTPSLEALKAFSLAYAEANRGSYRTAIPFYKRAIELDPDFAVAYAHMGQAYANSGQNEPAVESIKQAFQRRSRASELEKFYIETRYYELVTGEVEKRIEILQLWKKMYPRDPIATNDLAAEYTDAGRYEQALEEAQKTVQLAPHDFTGYVLLGVSYMGLDRFAEARAVRQEQIAMKLADMWDHVELYGLAYLQNDAATMQREAEWAKGQPDEYRMVRSIARRAASLGKLKEAREAYRQAIESAQRNGSTEAAKDMAVELDLVEVLVGNMPKTGPEARAATAPGGDTEVLTNAGRVLAMRGDARSASAIADGWLKRSPTNTYVNNVFAPAIRAEVEINRGNPARAIDLLQAASAYEFGWKAKYLPNYVRGRAYLGARRGKEAAGEFEKILAHRGVSLAGSSASLQYALSYLQLARARTLSGDAAGARRAYQDFLSLWKDADPDVPVLKEARAELAKLQ